MRDWRYVVGLGSLAGFLVAGCGGGSSITVRKAFTPADNALAAKVGLSLADFPAGWTRQLGGSEKSSGASQCATKAIASLTETGKAKGPTFISSGSSSTAQAETVVFKSRSDAVQAFAFVTKDATILCVSRALQTYVSNRTRGQATIGTVTSGEARSPGIGQESAAFHLDIPIQSHGLAVDFSFDFVSARAGRVLTISAFVSPGTFNQALEKKLINTLGQGLLEVASS